MKQKSAFKHLAARRHDVPDMYDFAVQIREEPVQSEVQGPLQEGGLETQLAHAEACLISGQLLAAASQLQKAVQVLTDNMHVCLFCELI